MSEKREADSCASKKVPSGRPSSASSFSLDFIVFDFIVT